MFNQILYLSFAMFALLVASVQASELQHSLRDSVTEIFQQNVKEFNSGEVFTQDTIDYHFPWSNSLAGEPAFRRDGRVFAKEDEPAMMLATSVVARQFMHAAGWVYFAKMTLIERAQLEAKKEANQISQSDFQTQEQTLAERFNSESQAIYISLAALGEDYAQALNLCHSQACVDRLAHTARTINKFSQALSNKQQQFEKSDTLVQAILHIAITQPDTDAASIIFKKVLGELRVYWYQQQTHEELITALFGDHAVFNGLQLTLGTADPQFFDANEEWLSFQRDMLVQNFQQNTPVTAPPSAPKITKPAVSPSPTPAPVVTNAAAQPALSRSLQLICRVSRRIWLQAGPCPMRTKKPLPAWGLMVANTKSK